MGKGSQGKIGGGEARKRGDHAADARARATRSDINDKKYGIWLKKKNKLTFNETAGKREVKQAISIQK